MTAAKSGTPGAPKASAQTVHANHPGQPGAQPLRAPAHHPAQPPKAPAQPAARPAPKPASPVPVSVTPVVAAPPTPAGPVAPAVGKPLASSYISEVPFQQPRIGAAAIYCSDGRYGDQMDEFLHHALGLPRYDRVAVPGGCACLAHITALREAGALEKQLRFLIEGHKLDRIVLIAHEDCGFYKHVRLRGPLYEQQLADLKLVAEKIRAFGQKVQVEAYFARKVDEMVRFEPVTV